MQCKRPVIPLVQILLAGDGRTYSAGWDSGSDRVAFALCVGEGGEAEESEWDKELHD